MVRGNQYLEFDSDQSVGNDRPHPAERPRRVPHPNDDANPAGLFVLFLLSMSVIAVLGPLANKGTAPAATVPSAGRQVQPPEAAAPTKIEISQRVSPPPVHQFQLTALDGRTYRVESRTGNEILGELPPGFLFAYAAFDLPVHDAPVGNLLWRAPQGTRFLYTAAVYREPCWRWMVTLDGAHKGYFCPDSAPEMAKPPAERSPSLPATFTYEYDGWMHEAPLYPEEERIPLAPPGSGCASVPGIVQTLTIGGGSARRYELPLCGYAGRQFQLQ